MINKFGGSRLIAAIITVAIAISIDLTSAKGLSDNAALVLWIVYVAFVLSKVLDSVSLLGSETPSEPSSSGEPGPQIQASLDSILQNQATNSQALQYIVKAVQKSTIA